MALIRLNFFLSFFVFYIFIAPTSQAEELLEVNQHSKIELDNNKDIRNELTKEAVKLVSEKYISEILGPEKYFKEKNKIEAKIISNYIKYIPILKLTNINKSQTSVEADVYMRMSIENLKKLLQMSALLYETKGSPIVVPMISIIDKVNSKSFYWWSTKPEAELSYLKDWLASIYGQLKLDLNEKEFFCVQPLKWNLQRQIPETLKVENPNLEDSISIAQILNGSVVVRGQMNLSNSIKFPNAFSIEVQLEALQTSNGRVIGEVIRSFETNSGNFHVVIGDKLKDIKSAITADLTSQIIEAWQKGTFGSSLIQLTVNGKLNYRQLDVFKESLKNGITEIRQIRERRLQSGSFTYEIDSSLQPKDLADLLIKKNFPRYKVEVTGINSNTLALDVVYR
jgi:hypothetical protein